MPKVTPKKDDLTGYFNSLSREQISQIFISEIGKKKPSLELIKYLISLGAYVNNSHNFYRFFTSPLRLAVKMGHLPLIKILIESGANVNENILFNGTLLHTAAEYGQLEIAKFFVSLGIWVNVKTAGGATPLHFAAKSGQVEVVKFLLDSGADVNSPSNYCTPIYWAVIGNKVGVVKLLIEHGADLKVVYYGSDGYGGENMDLIKAATTASCDISMAHKVTSESHQIVKLIKEAMFFKRPEQKKIK